MIMAWPGPRRVSPRAPWLLAAAAGLSALTLCFSSQAVSPTPGPAETVRVEFTPTRVPASSPGASPAPTETQAPSPTPVVVHRLTSGGCCAEPTWGPDSQAVYFLDRPSQEGELGIFRVDIDGRTPALAYPGVGVLSGDFGWMATDHAGRVTVTHLADGTQWMVPSEGRMVGFSPASDQVYWQTMSTDVTNVDKRRWDLTIGDLHSHAISSPVGGIGGGFVGWGPKESQLLFSGRQQTDGPAGLWVSNLDGSDRRLLFQADRIASPLVSPSGGWVALPVTFSGDTARDGLWVIPTDGAPAVKLSFFGAFRWRAEGELLVIPLEASGGRLRLIQVEARSGQGFELMSGSVFPQSVAGNTWEPSPDGAWIVFRSGEDGNLWLVGLPGPGAGP